MRVQLPFTFCLLVTVSALPAVAQPSVKTSGSQNAQQRCVTVAVSSQNDALTARLLSPYLESRRDFQAESLALSEDTESANVVVKLSAGELGSTKFRVTNSMTGESVVAVSSWTEFPGMVAMDVMTVVRRVCPPPIELVPRPAALQARTATSEAFLRGFTVCSYTLWMSTGEMYEAIHSRGELRQRSIHVVEGCDEAGTMLEITHEASDPVEWQWKLKSGAGQAVAAGCVIARSSSDAAAKIAEEVVGDVTVRGNAAVQGAINEGVANPWANSQTYPGMQGQTVAAAPAKHPHGFKRVVGQVGWWTGQVIVDAAVVAGYVALAAAEGAP